MPLFRTPSSSVDRLEEPEARAVGTLALRRGDPPKDKEHKITAHTY